MQVILPVAPLTKRIILARTGQEQPVRFSMKDHIFQQLNYSKLNKRKKLLTMQRICTETITLELNTKLVQSIGMRMYEAGYHLYNFHLHMMLTYIEAQCEAGIYATDAIRNFYEKYNISEDDFDMDSAYKRWVRHLQNVRKKGGKIKNFAESNDREKYKSKSAPFCATIPLDERQVEEVIQMILERYSGYRGQAPQSLPLHLSAYLLYKESLLNTNYIAEKLEMSRSNVYFAINNIENMMDTDGLFRQSYAFGITHARPVKPKKMLASS